MHPRKNFEILRTAMTILMLFEQFLRQILFKYFAFSRDFFTKYRYDAFCLHIFNLCVVKAYLCVDFIVIEKVQNYGKTKTLLKTVGGGMHPPGTILLCPSLKMGNFQPQDAEMRGSGRGNVMFQNQLTSLSV